MPTAVLGIFSRLFYIHFLLNGNRFFNFHKGHICAFHNPHLFSVHEMHDEAETCTEIQFLDHRHEERAKNITMTKHSNVWNHRHSSQCWLLCSSIPRVVFLIFFNLLTSVFFGASVMNHFQCAGLWLEVSTYKLEFFCLSHTFEPVDADSTLLIATTATTGKPQKIFILSLAARSLKFHIWIHADSSWKAPTESFSATLTIEQQVLWWERGQSLFVTKTGSFCGLVNNGGLSVDAAKGGGFIRTRQNCLFKRRAKNSTKAFL